VFSKSEEGPTSPVLAFIDWNVTALFKSVTLAARITLPTYFAMVRRQRGIGMKIAALLTPIHASDA
jgi:hypothetical protein